MKRWPTRLGLGLLLGLLGAHTPSASRAERPAEKRSVPEKRGGARPTDARPAPPRGTRSFAGASEATVEAELRARREEAKTFPELLEGVTRGLLAAPYVLSPLGEGSPPDTDPRFRLDAFDCTTFVETAIALGGSDDLENARTLMDRIRYIDAETRFEARRHLMSTEWVPGLIADGFLEDVTVEVGGASTQWIELEMTAQRWKKRRVARTLDLPLARVPMGRFRVPYVRLEDAIAAADRIPTGTIINIIRRDVPSSPDVITHQGLVVERPGDPKRYVRHASPVSKQVIDEELVHMMTRYKKPRKWPIIGASFLRVIDRRER